MFILMKKYYDGTFAKAIAVSEDKDVLIDKIRTLPGGKYDIIEAEYIPAEEKKAS